MTLTAAAAVLVVSLPGVLAQWGWRVTCASYQFCALKGSTVDISCTYTYPSLYYPEMTVEKRCWYRKVTGKDKATQLEYAGQVEYMCDDGNTCTLRITHLRENDRADYKFRLTTKNPANVYSGPEVSLTVTGLTVKSKQAYSGNNGEKADLECQTSCKLPNNPTFIWYKNGEKIKEGRSPQANGIQYGDGDSFQCAVRGHEDSPSPSLCLAGGSCNHVTYAEGNICAFKGSSVDISCTFNSYESIVSKFWFSPQRDRRWKSPSQPEDLREDPQFAGRIQLLVGEAGRSTLRITQLRESDAAEYRFKFTTPRSEWKGEFPGPTVTVTDVHMQVTSTNVTMSQSEAELKCVSSCRPAGPVSFIWVKNGQKYQGETFSGRFSPGDEIYCAMARHEDYHSPTLYAPVVPSVTASVSPDDIIEGRSMNLTCAGNGATVKISWYKKDGSADVIRVGGKELVFESIKSSDSGEYHCRAESQLGSKRSGSIWVDVQYPPRSLFVSMVPSNDFVVGSTVTLNCSSDANPAANYSWFKANERSPRASGQTFIITNFTANDSGDYYCEATNSRGSRSISFQMTMAGKWTTVTTNIIRLTLGLMLVLLLPCVCVWMRRQRCQKMVTQSDCVEELELNPLPDCRYISTSETAAEA